MSYTELAWIGSNGAQYIDTGFLANPNCSIEVSFMVSKLTTNWDTIFGARNGSNSRFTARFINNEDGKLGFQYSNSGAGTAVLIDTEKTKSYFTNGFHTIRLAKNVASIDGVVVNTFSSPLDSVAYPYSLYLFANNNKGTPGDFAYIKISYCKIWNAAGNLVRDYIPALDGNSIACLYDRISGEYSYNKGTGVFSVPVGEILRSIESDGTQYINLEYIHTANTKIELDCYVFSNTQRSFEALFGSRYRSYQSNALVFFTRFGGEDSPVYNRSGYENKGSGFPYNQRIKLACYQKLARWTSADGSIGSIASEGTANEGVAPLFLFDLNNAQSSGNLKPDNSRSVVRLYGLKIYEDDVLVRDYIPTLDANETACLYEKIESRVYYPESGNPLGYQTFGAYLIRSNSTLYTITDGALTTLTETEITANLFQTYGVDDLPDSALLVGLTNPEVLYWQTSQDNLPTLTMTVKGTPPLPQVFTSEQMDLTHESIAGIDHAAVDSSEDVRFAISFDDGTTWQAFDGSAWFDVSDTAPGMLASTMNAITAAQWAGIVQLTAYRLRFWLPNVTAFVKSVVIHYINP